MSSARGSGCPSRLPGSGAATAPSASTATCPSLRSGPAPGSPWPAVRSLVLRQRGLCCHAPCTPRGPLDARSAASGRVARRTGSTAIVTDPGRLGVRCVATAGSREGRTVARIIVEVMLKPEIRDPQGEAILRACRRLGFGDVLGIRQGKRFEVEVAGTADERLLARVGELAGELLANPVIEEFTFREA